MAPRPQVKRAWVLEVSDNPGIDHGVEGAYLGEELYMQVRSEFMRRLEVRIDNLAALRLNERLGCAPVAEPAPGYYADNTRGLRMDLALDEGDAW